jgi:hypothetical protein
MNFSFVLASRRLFLLVRGCPRLGQPIEKPISPRPSGTGIFPALWDAGAEAEGPAPQFGHFPSPEGRKQNSPGLQPWEGVPKQST